MKLRNVIFCGLIFVINSFAQSGKYIVIEPTGASTGEMGNRADKLIVYGTVSEASTLVPGANVYLSLGVTSDLTAKARYATVLSAISLGKKVELVYWTTNSSTNTDAWIDENPNLTKVKMR
jgi:hypothetical protein